MIRHSRRARRALFRLAVAATAGCGGSAHDHTIVTPPPPPVLATLTVALGHDTLRIGGTTTASVAGADADGGAVTVEHVVWTAGTMAASVDSTGLVTGLTPGLAAIVATVGTIQAQALVTVTPVPVDSIVVVPATVSLLPGTTLPFTARALDSAGRELSGRLVAWSSSDSATATVSAGGLVTGVALGTATISAASEGKVGTGIVTVTVSATDPMIGEIAPAVLTPGGAATITGVNFSATASADSVTIDGVPAVVTAASSTQLSVSVPAALPCTPLHRAAVVVRVAGKAAPGSQLLRVGTLDSLGVGGTSVITSPAALDCLELPSDGSDYIVSVFDNSQTPTAVTAFRISGTGGAVPADRLAPPAVSMRQGVARPGRAAALPGDADPFLRDARMHQRVLDANRAIYPTVRAAFAAHRALVARGAPARNLVAAAVAPGTTRTFRVNQFSTTLNGGSGCSSYREITAKVVYVSSRAVLWEDVAAPLAGTMDAQYAQLGQEFDGAMYTTDSTYFGDPLATDPYTDDDQHLNMVFTPAVPSGLAGFVTGCDLVPRDSATDPSSNFGEFFYAVVPTVAGTDFTQDTPAAWLRSIRSTVVHEVKHISSFGARLTNGASVFEESWLEEGMARMAEELWLRNYIYHAQWKGNALYGPTLYCDVRPTFPECAGAPYGMYRHFSTLAMVLENPGASSLFGRVADNDFNFYAMSWSFARWAADRYATTEAAFFRGITQATTTSGTASIAQLTGQPVDQMLGDWVLAQYLDDTPAVSTNIDVQQPTWNTRDIFNRMHLDFPNTFPVFPLVPVPIAMGTFAADNGGIHGGAFAAYELSADAPLPQTISLRGVGGVGPAPSTLRIAIGRIR